MGVNNQKIDGIPGVNDIITPMSQGPTKNNAENRSATADLYAGRETDWIRTAALCVIAAVAMGVALIYTRAILVPFVMAIFIVTLVSPLLDFQVLRLKWPRLLAVIITLLIVLAIIAVIGLIFTELITQIIATVRSYSDNFVNLAKTIVQRVEGWGVELDEGKIISELQQMIPAFVSATFGSIMGIISNLALISIFLIFLLAGRNPRVIHQGIYAEIDQKIRRYIGTKMASSVVTGLLVWLILTLFKLEMAGVFGMLAFLLNFIPSVGSIIATVLPLPVAVAQYNTLGPILGVILIPGAIQIFIGNGIEPKIMGRGLNLHPVTILLALSFWGLLWGIVGMFLAAPITAAIRVILMQFDQFRPLADLLAGQLPAGNPLGKK